MNIESGNQFAATRLTLRTVSLSADLIKMKQFHWTRCRLYGNGGQFHELDTLLSRSCSQYRQFVK